MTPQVGDIWESPWHPPFLLLEFLKKCYDEWYFTALNLERGSTQTLIFQTGGSWRRVA